MDTVRRLYFYFVSLASVLISLHGILRLAQSLLAGTAERNVVAFNVALLVVALPVYVFHWFLAQRAVASGQDHPHSAARKFYLYAVLLATVLIAAFHAHVLLERLFLAATGATRWPARAQIGSPLAALLVAGLFWAYHRYLAKRDCLLGAETEPGATWSRIYLYVTAAIGLALFAVGFADLLRALLRSMIPLTGNTQLALDLHLARDVASLLVGGVVWVSHWVWAQRRFRSGPAEQRSVVRKVFLYLVVLAAAIAALTSTALLLRDFLRLLLGTPNPGNTLLLDRLTWPVTFIVEGSLFWVYHWRTLQADICQTPEAPRQASLRRLYYYLVSGAGLVLVAWGLAHLLGALIASGTFWAQQIWGGDFVYQFNTDWFREQVSLNVAMLVVGTPVWVWHWRVTDRLAHQPDDPAGFEERRSVLRKAYIYLALFAAAVMLLIQPAQFVYRLLNVLLGAPMPHNFWDQVAGELSNSLVAALLWAYHWLALRHDRQLGEGDAHDREIAPCILILDTGTGELGCEVGRQLRRKLPTARLIGYGLGDPAKAALAACLETSSGDLPAQLAEAGAVVAPLSILLPDADGTISPAAQVLASSQVPRILIPMPEEGLTVAGVREKSLQSLAHAAAQAATQLV
ncbi:MAG: DUF3842 family protein [Chloroflexi bacterium]|nr:DUF3842 family protein [Chloroflexota bacterium]